MQKVGMKQSKADPCMFRTMVDGEISLIVYVHVYDIHRRSHEGQR